MSREPPPASALADAWLKRATTLFNSEPAAALHASRKALQLSISDPKAPYVTGQVFALLVQGVLALNVRQAEQAEAFFRKATAIAEQHAGPELQASSLACLAMALNELQRSEETLAICDELWSRFRNGPGPVTSSLVAFALLLKGALLTKIDQSAALEAFDEVIRRYGNPLDSHVRGSVVDAIVAKCALLPSTGQLDEALAISKSAISTYGTEQKLQEMVELSTELSEIAAGLATPKEHAAATRARLDAWRSRFEALSTNRD